MTSLSLFTFMHWRRKWQPTPVFLPGKSQGLGSLVGCCLWGRTELDMTERLHFYFSLSCIGEGNGNPLQCSCLENPRDGGAWWGAVSGVAQSRKRLKQLSSSSSILQNNWLSVIFSVISTYKHNCLLNVLKIPHHRVGSKPLFSQTDYDILTPGSSF